MAPLHVDKLSLVASLLLNHPMCLDCLSANTGLSTSEANRHLSIIGGSLEMRRSDERCPNCGTDTPIYSLHSLIKSNHHGPVRERQHDAPLD
jgi:hypothetical protein